MSALRRMFSLVGYKVTTAESASAALELLEKTPVDAIICDMRMPNMDGAQFFEIARKKWPDTVRILLTGYSDMTSAIAAVNQGEIYRYLSKPWVDDELCSTLKSALEFSELKRERERLLELTQRQNAELEARVAERTLHLSEANTKLRSSYVSSIKAFSNLLDLRKPNLLVHSRKVAFLSMQMAKLAQFDEKHVQEVFIAGLLHDIGKIGMSDRVLKTNITELPVSDLELYKSHPALGSVCLVALDDMSDVAAMIRSHHERFDGNGFPDGLAGDKIPMGARIISVVETYEELMSGDVTTAPMDKDKAKKTIASLSGKYFCPKVVQLFLSALEGKTDAGAGFLAESAQQRVKKEDSSPNTPKTNHNSAQSANQATNPKSSSKVGTNLVSGPTYKEFSDFLKQFPNAAIKDLRDESNGFLWVFEGMKRYNEDDKLGNWLKSHKFVWSEAESAWYFPII